MTPRVLILLAAFALLAFALIFGPAACRSYLAEKQAGEIARGQNEATLESLDEANRKTAVIDKLEAAIERETKELADEVRSAPAGDSNDAADRSLCRSRAYRETARCRELNGAGR